jgi:hypothetical protein
VLRTIGAASTDISVHPTISSADAEPEYPIQGSRQDFDFLIVFDQTIVTIEAKATGSWDRRQYESKCKRLSALQTRSSQRMISACSSSSCRPARRLENWMGFCRTASGKARGTLVRRSDAPLHLNWAQLTHGQGTVGCDTQQVVIALLAARP